MPDPDVAIVDGCSGCRGGRPFPVAITMAFQPIVDVERDTVFAYEALVRGADGRSARDVLACVDPETIYKFDQLCRVTAIRMAGELFGADSAARVSINFMPGAMYEADACIRASLIAAQRAGVDSRRLMFEFTEDERMRDVAHVQRIVEVYRAHGLTTAIDDFGAGYAGLGLLADLQPDMVKLDMALIRNIDTSQTRQTIVAGVVQMTRAMGIDCIAEGIETASELRTLRALGISLCQGYLLAKPAIAAFPAVSFN